MVGVKVMVFLMAVSMCASRNRKVEFIKHIDRLAAVKYPCEVPQPKVVYIKDIVSEQMWEDVYKDQMQHMRPVSTVLHRCEGTGCCTNYNHRCVAKCQEKVTLTFLTPRLKGYYVDIEATNHTKCGCEVVSDELIK